MSGRIIRKKMFEQGREPEWIPGNCAHCEAALSKHRSFTLDRVRVCQPCRKAMFFDTSGKLKPASGPSLDLGEVGGWTRWLLSAEVAQWLEEMDLPRNALCAAMRKETWNVDGMSFERSEEQPYLYRIEVGV